MRLLTDCVARSPVVASSLLQGSERGGRKDGQMEDSGAAAAAAAADTIWAEVLRHDKAVIFRLRLCHMLNSASSPLSLKNEKLPQSFFAPFLLSPSFQIHSLRSVL